MQEQPTVTEEKKSRNTKKKKSKLNYMYMTRTLLQSKGDNHKENQRTIGPVSLT